MPLDSVFRSQLPPRSSPTARQSPIIRARSRSRLSMAGSFTCKERDVHFNRTLCVDLTFRQAPTYKYSTHAGTVIRTSHRIRLLNKYIFFFSFSPDDSALIRSRYGKTDLLARCIGSSRGFRFQNRRVKHKNDIRGHSNGIIGGVVFNIDNHL